MKARLSLSVSALGMFSIPVVLTACAANKPTRAVAGGSNNSPSATAAKPRAHKPSRPLSGGAQRKSKTANAVVRKVPPINSFAERYNPDGTITYTWISHAVSGDWFRIEDDMPDGSKKVLYSTTYGSSKLPYVPGSTSYSLTLDPATDYLP